MNDLLQEMASDAAEQAMRLPSDDGLRIVADLANEQLRLQQLVCEQEAALNDLKEQLTEVSEVDLPSALEALGVASVTLSDGGCITIKESVFAGITEKNKEAAFEWLEATDNDGIINNAVECNFGKGQDSEAQRLTELLSSQGYSYTNTRSVNSQTLKAFVRKQLEEGLPIPVDVFSIHVKKTALIGLPKKK
jgi:hypothetical protein